MKKLQTFFKGFEFKNKIVCNILPLKLWITTNIFFSSVSLNKNKKFGTRMTSLENDYVMRISDDSDNVKVHFRRQS